MLSDRPAANTRAGALEKALDISNERISTLGSRVASKDLKISAKIAQVAPL